MKLTELRDLYKDSESFFGKEVTVGGWLRSNRDSKTFGFLTLSDGTDFRTLQIVYGDALPNFDEIAHLGVGCAVVAKGEIVATPDAKQPFEMQAKEVCVEGISPSDYPLQPNKEGYDQYGVLWRFPEGQMGAFPVHDDEHRVLKDICDCDKVLTHIPMAPPVPEYCLGPMDSEQI